MQYHWSVLRCVRLGRSAACSRDDELAFSESALSEFAYERSFLSARGSSVSSALSVRLFSRVLMSRLIWSVDDLVSGCFFHLVKKAKTNCEHASASFSVKRAQLVSDFATTEYGTHENIIIRLLAHQPLLLIEILPPVLLRDNLNQVLPHAFIITINRPM